MRLLDTKGKKTILVAIIVALCGWAGLKVTESDISHYVDVVIPAENTQAAIKQSAGEETPAHIPNAKQEFNRASIISPERRAHILYGDATGGGHLYGTGKPCKSEFPEYWDEQTVIKEVELIAANDNLNWEQQRNGYYVTEQKVGTINVRVVKDRSGEDVITAYPTNVPRNPCPANDNNG